MVWRKHPKVRRTEPAVHFDFGSSQVIQPGVSSVAASDRSYVAERHVGPSRKYCSSLPYLYDIHMTDSVVCLRIPVILPLLVPYTSIPPHVLLVSDANLPHMEEAKIRWCRHASLDWELHHSCARACRMLDGSTTPPRIVSLRCRQCATPWRVSA